MPTELIEDFFLARGRNDNQKTRRLFITAYNDPKLTSGIRKLLQEHTPILSGTLSPEEIAMRLYPDTLPAQEELPFSEEADCFTLPFFELVVEHLKADQPFAA